jgi:hypothetical protein
MAALLIAQLTERGLRALELRLAVADAKAQSAAMKPTRITLSFG